MGRRGGAAPLVAAARRAGGGGGRHSGGGMGGGVVSGVEIRGVEAAAKWPPPEPQPASVPAPVLRVAAADAAVTTAPAHAQVAARRRPLAALSAADRDHRGRLGGDSPLVASRGGCHHGGQQTSPAPASTQGRREGIKKRYGQQRTHKKTAVLQNTHRHLSQKHVRHCVKKK